MTQIRFDEARGSIGSAGGFHQPSFGYSRIFSAAVKVLADMFQRWNNRRAVYKLTTMDDRMLSDIGITRADLDKALATPLSTDASDVLAEIVQRKRAARSWALSHPNC